MQDLLEQNTEQMQQQQRAIVDLGIKRCRLRRTPSDYYDWSLEDRRSYLRAPSISNLCKSMLMVNKKAPVINLGHSPINPLYASHYLIIYVWI